MTMETETFAEKERFAVAAQTGAPANPIVRIQSLRPHMTQVEGRIADAILDDPQAVIPSTAMTLAAKGNVSEAAVSRFVRKLSFGGFAEFKLALSHALVTPAQAIHEDIELSDSISDVAHKVAAATVQALDDTMRVFDEEAMSVSVDLLDTARRIGFFGLGASAALAQDAWHHFLRILDNVTYISDTHEQAMWTASANEGDVLVLFSHTGASRDLVELALTAKSGNAKVITITNDGRSPLTDAGDVSLFTSTRESRFREESMSSRFAVMALIDTLYISLAIRRHESLMERRHRLQMALQQKKVYERRSLR